jgi:hypothetical protein
MISARTELAGRVLQILRDGGLVTTEEALQLRNCAVTQEDGLLSLEEIASRILREDRGKESQSA